MSRSYFHPRFEVLESRRLLAGDYAIDSVPLPGAMEHRLLLDGFHFATLIDQAPGTMILRAHPDTTDANGWGSSLYLNPFVGGLVPQGGEIELLEAQPDGVQVNLRGTLSDEGPVQIGQWSLQIGLHFDPETQRMSTSNGQLEIVLTDTLTALNADLNVYRLASNLLTDVPLQSGGIGQTGDIDKVLVQYAAEGDPRDFAWLPADLPGHFPTDASTHLTVKALGDTNEVDTLALGESFQIEVARKPSMSVSLTSTSGDVPVIFGGIFDTSQAANFAADNIGITPLVLQNATDATTMTFAVDIIAAPPHSSPLLQADKYVVDAGFGTQLDVLSNDAGMFGGPLRVTNVSSTHAEAQVTVDGSGKLAYAPSALASQWDHVVYEVVDEWGAISSISTDVLIIPSGASAWQNPVQHEDVDADGRVRVLDAIFILSDLIAHGPRDLPNAPLDPTARTHLLDVNGNRRSDVLDVIHVLSRLLRGDDGEPEALPAERSGSKAGLFRPASASTHEQDARAMTDVQRLELEAAWAGDFWRLPESFVTRGRRR